MITTFDNRMSSETKHRLASMIGMKLERLSATFDNEYHSSSWSSFASIMLQTLNDKVYLHITELSDDVFPDVSNIEALREKEWLEKEGDSLWGKHPDEWFSESIGKTIRGIRLFTDIGTDVRGDEEEQYIVHDACAIALFFDDEVLLFEKMCSWSEIWNISHVQPGKIELMNRIPEKIVFEDL